MGTIKVRIIILSLIVASLAVYGVDAGSAQVGVSPWEKPINLSHSGIASNPHLFIDGNGDMVGYWPETHQAQPGRATVTSGTVTWQGDQWSPPVLTELPFASGPHTLISGSGSVLHAFWIDDLGRLRFKTATSASLSSLSGWGISSSLAESVIAFSVKKDFKGHLQLAYISADNNPANTPGVFFRLSTNSGVSWSSPKLLYRSDYFRQFSLVSGPSAQPGQSQPASPSVDVAVADSSGTPNTIVTWDDPGLKRVYLATWDDSSPASWSEPLQVAKPNLQDPYTTPAQPKLYSLGDQILFLAQDIRNGGSCSVFMKDSNDSGATWAPIQTPSILMTACPKSLAFLGLQDGASIFSFLSPQGQLVLIAFQNGIWSQPQVQLDLGSFANPETYSAVQLGCPSIKLKDQTLFLLACDLAGGGDIWYTSRSLGDPAGWFTSPESWQTIGSKDIGSDAITSFDLVSDESGGIHSVGTLTKRLDTGALSSTIDYFGTELGEVIGPFPIVTGIAGRAEQATMAVSGGNQLTLMWRSGKDGDLSFSSTQAQKGSSSSGWVKAATISQSQALGSDPSLASNKDALVAAYVIPFNEHRGLYFISWDASTQTWSDPVEVFDGVAGGCPMVSSPTIDFGVPHTLHVVWLCSNLPGGEGTYEVDYADSTDGGLTWGKPKKTWNANAHWAVLAALGDGSVHVFWGQASSDGQTAWHVMSRDGGLSWSDPINFDFQPGPEGPAAKVVVAGTSSLFFLQPIQPNVGPPKLRIWYWSGNGWLQMPGLELHAGELSQLEGWGAALTPAKQLVVAYVAGNGQPKSSGSFDQQILFAQLAANLPEFTPARPEETPTLSSVTTPTLPSGPTAVAQGVESTPLPLATSAGGNAPMRLPSLLFLAILGLLIVGGGIIVWRRM